MNVDAVTLDADECIRFLRFWSDLTDTPHMTLVSIVPDGKTSTRTFARGDLDGAKAWITAQQEQRSNIYFEPNETPAGCASKPSKSMMVAALCRFADIDPDDEHHPLVDERDRLIQLADHLASHPTFAPTAIIDSGNGIQPLWAVAREPLDEVVLSRVEAETRDIEAAMGAAGTHNIDRLLRLPGTVNYPNGKKRGLGRGVTQALLLYCAPNLYSTVQAGELAEHLKARLSGSGLVREKCPKPDPGPPPDPDDASVNDLIVRLQSAGAEQMSGLEDLSEELVQRLRHAFEWHPRLERRWAGDVEDLRSAGKDCSRSGADLSLAALLKGAGLDHLDTGLALCAFAHGKANNNTWANPRLRLRHVARAVLRSHDLPAFVQEFNNKYMVVNEAGKGVVYAPVFDAVLQRQRFDRISFDDLRRLYLNRRELGFDRKGKVVRKNAASAWLEHPGRRQFISGVTFDPSGRSDPGTLNLWQGFAVKPEPGDWSLMEHHIREVICNKDDMRYQYLMFWLARMVQNPAQQGEVAVVLRGGEGTGKGIFAKAVLHLLGQHGIAISNARHLVGNFNGHLRDCIFLFADEAFFAGDKQHVGVLKSLITERHLTIESKYQNAVQTRNFLHVMMASNEEWVVPAALDARRFLVLVVSEHRKSDHNYFAAIMKQMGAGGYEAMLHDLLNLDIGGFNVRAVPVTDGLQQQKKLSLPTFEAWWVDILHRGYVYNSRFGLEAYFREWHNEVATEVLYKSYKDHAMERRERHPLSREEFGKKMLSFGAKRSRPREMVTGEHITDVKNSFGGTTREAALIRQPRPPSYQLGILEEARAAFTTATGLDIDWQEDADGSGSSTMSGAASKWQHRL